MSCFVATNTLLTSSGALFSICDIHFSMFLNEVESETEYARIMPAAPLQYVWVMFLNLYWPAVSHICILNVLSPIGNDFILKSTPIVATYVSLKWFSQNLVIRFVLPTPLSPMTITLTEYILVFFPSIILEKYIELQQTLIKFTQISLKKFHQFLFPKISKKILALSQITFIPISEQICKMQIKKSAMSPLIKSSSLILLTPTPTPKTMLLKRKSTMSFNSSYVFPGGVVEDSDRDKNNAYNNVFQEYSKITALREFFQETGLLLCPKEFDFGNGNGNGVGEMSVGEIGGIMGEIWGKGLQFLQPVLRLMTPQIQKGKRFDCIFHILTLTPQIKIYNFSTKKQLQHLDPGEIPYNKQQSDDLIIETPLQILQKWKQNKITLAPPQIIIMQCLANFIEGRNKNGNTLLGINKENGEEIQPIMFDFQVQLGKMVVFGDGGYREGEILAKEPESQSKKQYQQYITKSNKNKTQKGIRRIQLSKTPKLISSNPQAQQKTLLKYILSPSPSPKL